jgi:hypothetical protein
VSKELPMTTLVSPRSDADVDDGAAIAELLRLPPG